MTAFATATSPDLSVEPAIMARTTAVPVVDLSSPGSAGAVASACGRLGFFKAVNHGIPAGLLERLEAEALAFFSLPQNDKLRTSSGAPLGYGHRRIGPNGDLGLLEFLMLSIGSNSIATSALHPCCSVLAARGLTARRRMPACPRHALQPASPGTVTHLSPRRRACIPTSRPLLTPPPAGLSPGCRVCGGDPCMEVSPPAAEQLPRRSTCRRRPPGKHSTWRIRVPDEHLPVCLPGAAATGDGELLCSLPQLAWDKRLSCCCCCCCCGGGGGGGERARLSAIYFGAPAPAERIMSVPELIGDGEASRYRSFTWREYKAAAYGSARRPPAGWLPARRPGIADDDA
ncbi:hypothetical protein PAHAL_5G211200 [Panicum hallii]|uniref:Non-haem dioxygenase N-terminal domain-containing protein n=1 Tax=Panicum hallii TaxID=206008 RepID=A0A2T8IKQ0_9POAL|nr:hypothetical protein PAHAL_5G211200 [Panicum hallii]